MANPTYVAVENDQKPKRGRPRGGKADVAEKRRQQLRLAQRAYRDRKENTINSLQKRVEYLTGQIEQINQSFIDFSDLLLESNVLANHPNLTSSLGCLTKKCISLAQHIYDSESEDGSGNLDTAADIDSDEVSAKAEESPQMKNVITPRTNVPSPDYSPPVPSKWRKPALSNTVEVNRHDQRTEANTALATIEISSPSAGLQPPLFVRQAPPIETVRINFIKSLVQHCCRGAYSLLVNPQSSTRTVEEVFGSNPLFQARNNMISSLYQVSYIGEKSDVALRANVLATLREQLTRGSMEYSEASARAWDIAFGTISGTEWLDANEVLKLLIGRGIQTRGNDLFIPIQRAGFYASPQSAFLFDMVTFIKAISVRAICMCPGPAFKRRDVEDVIDFLVANYETINRPSA